MADVTLRKVVKTLRRGRGGARHRSRHRRPRVRRAGRTVGLRQVDDAADDRRPGGHHRRRHHDRRRRRQRRAAEGPRHRDGVPELRALSAHDGAREHVVRAAAEALSRRPRSRRRVDEAARILDITELLDRKPKQLSGGQRQRVAMGRAIVRNPKVFLFDEPLSNLDAKLRVQMRIEIKKVHQKVRTTTVYVTHDQVEAMTLADRVVVMNHGRIEQIGTPNELYHKPATQFVAGFIGSPAMNFIPCRLEDVGGKLHVRLTDRIAFPLPPARAARYQSVTRNRQAAARPAARAHHRGQAASGARRRALRRRARRHRADGHGDADLFHAGWRRRSAAGSIPTPARRTAPRSDWLWTSTICTC